MARTASVVTQRMVELLTAQDAGINPALAQLAIDSGDALAPAHIVSQNVAFELAERSQGAKYRVVQVYPDRVRNTLTEKFRNFSGKVRMVAEVRISQDRLEGLEDRLRLYVDAVTQVLDSNRGSWGQGAYYAGGYEAAYEPVRHGGKNFLQIAKVTFEVDLSA